MGCHGAYAIVSSITGYGRPGLRRVVANNPIGLLVVVCAIATLPAIVLGFPNSHSLYLNLNWHTGFAEQFLSGELYPRWLPLQHNGLGSPVFFFYPPLAFYFSSVVEALSFALLPERQVLGVTAFLLLFLSGLSSFVWFRQFAKPAAACAGAVIYVIAPYHLTLDLYERGALAEFASYALVPLLFVALRLYIRGHKAVFFLPSLIYCALILCHLPTALLISPFAILYLFFEAALNHSSRPKRVETISLALLSMIAGIGLSSIYLLPALTTQDYISTPIWWTGYYHYSNWFLFEEKLWPNPAFMREIQFFALTNLLMFAALAVFVWRKEGRLSPHLCMCLAALPAAFSLMTGPTKIVWEMLPLLQKVQFPWRLMAVMDFCFASAVVIAIGQLKHKGASLPKFVKLWLACLAVVWIPASIILAKENMVSWASSPDHLQELNLMQTVGYGGLEYVPRWSGATQNDLLYGQIPDVEVMEGEGQVEIKKSGREIEVSADMEESGMIAIRSFYYPGWAVQGEDSGEAVKILSPDSLGRMILSVPRGKSDFVLVLKRFEYEVLGIWSSCLVFVFLLLITMFRFPTRLSLRRT